MFPIPDTLAAFYLTCFAVGLIFVIASLALGLTHDTLHLPGIGHGDGAGHVDLGHDGGIHAEGHDAAQGSHDGGDNRLDGRGISPINVSTITAFLTWFGGAGYILRVYEGVLGFLSVLIATLAGLVGGALIFFFLARVLLPGQRFLDATDYEMVGTVARVTVPLGGNRTGEIVYSHGGSRMSDGARSADGSPIDRDTEVVIVRYERGIAYVEPWKSYIAKG